MGNWLEIWALLVRSLVFERAAHFGLYNFYFVNAGASSSTGFSLWNLVLARPKPHRLKPVLLNANLPTRRACASQGADLFEAARFQSARRAGPLRLSAQRRDRCAHARWKKCARQVLAASRL